MIKIQIEENQWFKDEKFQSYKQMIIVRAIEACVHCWQIWKISKEKMCMFLRSDV